MAIAMARPIDTKNQHKEQPEPLRTDIWMLQTVGVCKRSQHRNPDCGTNDNACLKSQCITEKNGNASTPPIAHYNKRSAKRFLISRLDSSGPKCHIFMLYPFSSERHKSELGASATTFCICLFGSLQV